MSRGIDDTHATAPGLAQDLVAREDAPRRQRGVDPPGLRARRTGRSVCHPTWSLSSPPAKIRGVQEGLPTTGQSPRELKAQLELEREGTPFLIHRDAAGAQHLTAVPESSPVRIGRAEGADVVLGFDSEVSRLHAEIERAGGEFLVVDDGLSSNGTYVNGSRVAGRRRLRDRDVVRVGETLLVFRNPADGADTATIPSGQLPSRRELTQSQLGVLEALCRPVRRDSVAAPATNGEIAEELHLSVGAVKAHLRTLFDKFAVEDLPQTRKRIRLAELALISGAVSPWDREPRPE